MQRYGLLPAVAAALIAAGTLAAPGTARADFGWLPGFGGTSFEALEGVALVATYEFGAEGSAKLLVINLPRGGAVVGPYGDAGNILCEIPLDASVAGAVVFHPSGRRAFVQTDRGLQVIRISSADYRDPGLAGGECSIGFLDVALGERVNELAWANPFSLRISPDGTYLALMDSATYSAASVGERGYMDSARAFNSGAPPWVLGAASVANPDRQRVMQAANITGANTQGRALLISTQTVGGAPAIPTAPPTDCPDEDRVEVNGVRQCPLPSGDNAAIDGARKAYHSMYEIPLSIHGDPDEVVMDLQFSPDGRRLYVVSGVSFFRQWTRCHRVGLGAMEANCPGASGPAAHLGVYDVESTASTNWGGARFGGMIANVSLPIVTTLPRAERGRSTPLDPEVAGRCGGNRVCTEPYHTTGSEYAFFDGVESLDVSPDGKFIYISSRGLAQPAQAVRPYDKDFHHSGGVGVIDAVKLERVAHTEGWQQARGPNIPARGGTVDIDIADVLVDFIGRETPGTLTKWWRIPIVTANVQPPILSVGACLIGLAFGFAPLCYWALAGMLVFMQLLSINWTQYLPTPETPSAVIGISQVKVSQDGKTLFIGGRQTQNWSWVVDDAEELTSNDPDFAGAENTALSYAEMQLDATYLETSVSILFSAMFYAIFGGVVLPTPMSLDAARRNLVEGYSIARHRFFDVMEPAITDVSSTPQFYEQLGSRAGASGFVFDTRWTHARANAALIRTLGRTPAAVDGSDADLGTRLSFLTNNRAYRAAFTDQWAVIYTHGDASRVKKLRITPLNALRSLKANPSRYKTWRKDDGVDFNPAFASADVLIDGSTTIQTAPDVLASESERPMLGPDSQSCVNCEPINEGDWTQTRVGWVATFQDPDYDNDGWAGVLESFNSRYWLYDGDAADIPNGTFSEGPIPGRRSGAPASVVGAMMGFPFTGTTVYSWEPNVYTDLSPVDFDFIDTTDEELGVHHGAGTEFGTAVDCWRHLRSAGPPRLEHYLGGAGCDDPYDGLDTDGAPGRAYTRLSDFRTADPSTWTAGTEHQLNAPFMRRGLWLPSRGVGYHHHYFGDPVFTDNFGSGRLIKAIQSVCGDWGMRFPEGPWCSVGDLSRPGGGQMFNARARPVGSGTVFLPAMQRTHFAGVEAEIHYFAKATDGSGAPACGSISPCPTTFAGAGDQEPFEIGRTPASRWHDLNRELICCFVDDPHVSRVDVNSGVLQLISGYDPSAPPDAGGTRPPPPDAQDVFGSCATCPVSAAQLTQKLVEHADGYTKSFGVVTDTRAEMKIDELSVEAIVEETDGGEARPHDFKIKVRVSGRDCGTAASGRVSIVLQGNGEALRERDPSTDEPTGRIVNLMVPIALDANCVGEITLDSLVEALANPSYGGPFTVGSFDEHPLEAPIVTVFKEQVVGNTPVGEVYASNAEGGSFSLYSVSADFDNNGVISDGEIDPGTEDAPTEDRLLISHRTQVQDATGEPAEVLRIQFYTPDERPALRPYGPPPWCSGPNCCDAGTCFTDESGYAYVTTQRRLRPRAELSETMDSMAMVFAEGLFQLGATERDILAAERPTAEYFPDKECDNLKAQPLEQVFGGAFRALASDAENAVDGVLWNANNLANEPMRFWRLYRASIPEARRHTDLIETLRECTAPLELLDENGQPDADAKNPLHIATLMYAASAIGMAMGVNAGVKDDIEDTSQLFTGTLTLGRAAKQIAYLTLFGPDIPQQQCTEGAAAGRLFGFGFCDSYQASGGCNDQLLAEEGRTGSWAYVANTFKRFRDTLHEEYNRALCPGRLDPQAFLDLADGTCHALPCPVSEGSTATNGAVQIINIIFGTCPSTADCLETQTRRIWDSAARDWANHGVELSVDGRQFKPKLNDGIYIYFRLHHHMNVMLGWIFYELMSAIISSISGNVLKIVGQVSHGLRVLIRAVETVERVASILKGGPAGQHLERWFQRASNFSAMFGLIEQPQGTQEGLLEQLVGHVSSAAQSPVTIANAARSLHGTIKTINAYVTGNPLAAEDYRTAIERIHSQLVDGQASTAETAAARNKLLMETWTALTLSNAKASDDPAVAEAAGRALMKVFNNPQTVMPRTGEAGIRAAHGIAAAADASTRVDQTQQVLDSEQKREDATERVCKCP